MNQESVTGVEGNREPIRVLQVEDNPMDALLLAADFSKQGAAQFRLTTAVRLSEAIQVLGTTPIDVILLDLFLEECTGLETLFRVREAAPGIPVVIVTALDDEQEALRALKHGAQDYLIKGNLDSKILFRSIRYAIERKQAEETLRSSEERYRELFENANDGIYTLDLDGHFTSANRMWQEMTGYSQSELVGKAITDLVPETFRDTLRHSIDCRDAEPMVYELQFVTKNGSHVPVEVSARLIKEKGKPIGLQGIARDRTDRRLFEQRLLQKQKLEAVGTLAGGVAHNFNNALTVILGYCNLMLEAMASDNEHRFNIASIKKAADRAALLTRQLHAFAQKRGAAPRPVSLNEIVLGMQLLLESVLGENITLQLKLAPNVSLIKGDPIQIEQIVMNLAVNSRDAMPQGGQLTIETAEVRSNPSIKLSLEDPAGLQVLLTVTDTGCGMSAETREHIFEPFFTTKGLAQASGLGLSTVYGLVKQSGGSIAVSSEIGRGTKFTLAFPAGRQIDCADVDGRSAKGATILIVDDKDRVREFLHTVLSERTEYTVLTARGWAEAAEVSFVHEGPIDLLITDVLRPGINGDELVKRLKRARPEMEVIYISGASCESITTVAEPPTGVHFLQKRIAPGALLGQVEEAVARLYGVENHKGAA